MVTSKIVSWDSFVHTYNVFGRPVMGLTVLPECFHYGEVLEIPFDLGGKGWILFLLLVLNSSDFAQNGVTAAFGECSE